MTAKEIQKENAEEDKSQRCRLLVIKKEKKYIDIAVFKPKILGGFTWKFRLSFKPVKYFMVRSTSLASLTAFKENSGISKCKYLKLPFSDRLMHNQSVAEDLTLTGNNDHFGISMLQKEKLAFQNSERDIDTRINCKIKILWNSIFLSLDCKSKMNPSQNWSIEEL